MVTSVQTKYRLHLKYGLYAAPEVYRTHAVGDSAYE